MDADIIHPRVQGIGCDAEFIDRWEDRKARHPLKQVKKRGGVPPAIYTDEQISRFRQLHLSGMTIDRMAKELNISVETVRLTAKRLGLRRRRHLSGPDDRLVQVTFLISIEDYSKIKKVRGRAHGQMSSFIRDAVRYKLDGVLS